MIKDAKNRPPEAPGPSTGAIVKRTLAHWPIIAAVMFVGAAATAEVVHLRKPSFKSETVIFYREGIHGVGVDRVLVRRGGAGVVYFDIEVSHARSCSTATAALCEVRRPHGMYILPIGGSLLYVRTEAAARRGRAGWPSG